MAETFWHLRRTRKLRENCRPEDPRGRVQGSHDVSRGAEPADHIRRREFGKYQYVEIWLRRLNNREQHYGGSGLPEVASHPTPHSQWGRGEVPIEIVRPRQRHESCRELAQHNGYQTTTQGQCDEDERKTERTIKHIDERIPVHAIHAPEDRAEASR